MKLIKLEPTDLYLTIDTERIDGYEYIGSYLEYEFDIDIEPYIKPSVKLPVSVLGMEEQIVTHFYDYQDQEYCYIFNSGHSFQSLMLLNEIEFDEDEIYSIFKKI
jgi:hypothetical protein